MTCVRDLYFMTRLAVWSPSFALQSQLVSTLEIRHQKLSSGPAGGGDITVGLATMGSGVFRPALITTLFRAGVADRAIAPDGFCGAIRTGGDLLSKCGNGGP